MSFWVRPIISGLLLNVALSMLRTNLEAGLVLSLPQLPVLLLTLGLCGCTLLAPRDPLQIDLETDYSRFIMKRIMDEKQIEKCNNLLER